MKKIHFEINTMDDLIEVIEQPEISLKSANELVRNSLKMINLTTSKSQLVTELQRLKDGDNKAIFLGIDLSL